ncbi:MAG: hypothetical protein ABIG70_03105 [Pseudomonadota bacterium]
MYLLPLYHPEEPTPDDRGWKFFIICNDKDGNESEFLNEIAGLGENRIDDFYSMLLQLTRLARQGKPWEVVIPDKKRMHDVGEFTLHHVSGKTNKEKVWEFRHADLRILWCYGGPGRIIVFGRILSKDQKKINQADVSNTGTVMNAYQTAYENGQIQIAGGEQNERAFGKLFPKSEAKPEVQK